MAKKSKTKNKNASGSGANDDLLGGGSGSGGSGSGALAAGHGGGHGSGGHGSGGAKGLHLKGTSGDDVLTGGDGNDHINGKDGNDTLSGGGGKDHIKGGSGDDDIDGGLGNDHLDGGSGDDMILGGGGNDHIKGGKGNDTIDGGSGNDKIDGGKGDDDIRGGGGDDKITGGAGDDEIYGGSGDDLILGDGRGGPASGWSKGYGRGSGSGPAPSFNDTLDGGSGNDVVIGGIGDDTVLGGTGNDMLYGDHAPASGSGSHGGRGSHASASGSGPDMTFNDYLDGGAGNDLLYGQLGDDVANYTVGENVGATDIYDGGAGVDRSEIQFTLQEWLDLNPALQDDLDAYLDFLALHTDPITGEADDAVFQFNVFDLAASQFEDIGTYVDGVEVDTADDAVVANDDAVSLNEDDADTAFASVFGNDSAPDFVRELRVIAEPTAGVLTFNPGTPGYPDGTFSFDPNDEFEWLADGESTTVSFVYEVEDSDGDVDQATVTITVTGSNDAPTITAAVDSGSVTEIVDNAAGENSATLSDGGTIDFADVDLTDTHTVSAVLVSATDSENGAVAARGSFTPVINDVSTGDGTGQVTWTYNVNDGALDDLAAGQSLTQVYTVTVTDEEGATADQTVTVTINGSNDAPTITAAIDSGSVTEIVDNAAGENNATLSDGGTIDFADVDLTDTHTVSAVLVSATDSENGAVAARGSFTPVINNVSTGDGMGQVTWTYNVNDGALDDLAAGQSLTQVYTVTVTDEEGATAEQTVTVTINGSNDAPTITATIDSGSVTEIVDNAAGENSATLSDGGTIDFADVDLTDTHTVSAVLVSATDSENGAVAARGSFTPVINDVSTGDGTGQVTWTYNVNDGALDDLAAGQSLTQVYTVTVTDEEGATAEQTVTVTINGSNDAPTITAAIDSGSVTEIVDNAAGENNATLSDGGTIDFADVDLTDTHTVSAVLVSATDSINGAAAARGSFTPVINNVSTGDGMGRVTWTYNVNGGALDDLAAGQSLTQVYTVTVTDEEGATAEQTVTVTINGSNDAPTITAAVDSGSVTEIVDNAAGENSATLSDGGTIDFADVDLTDTHTVSAVLVSATDSENGAVAARGSFTPVINDVSTGDGTGQITWTYNANDGALDDLAAGQSLTQVYTVTVTDEEGATADQTVTVTINGSNDAPTITAAIDSGSVTEIVDNAAGENNATLSDGGTIDFADVDLTDTHTVSAVLVSATDSINGAAAARGSFTPVINNVSTGDGMGQVTWTYNVNDGALDDLAAGQSLTQVYTVTVTDENGATADQTVTITVTGTNDAPVVSGPAALGDVDEDNSYTVTQAQLLSQADDDDTNDTMSAMNVTVSQGNASVLDNGNGTWTVTPAADWNGAVELSYDVTDGIANTAATANLTVNAVNDAPEIAVSIPTPNLIWNGSFETGPNPGGGFLTYDNGSTAINDWTVTDDSIDYISGSFWDAADGQRSIDLSGNDAGGVSQSFSTVVGALYAVTFQLAANTAGGDTVKDVTVSAGGSSQNFTFDSTGHGFTSMGWEENSFSFTATDTTSTLVITSLDSNATGPALDDVRVTADGLTVNEDTPLTISGMVISDVDETDNPAAVYSVDLAVDDGTLAVTLSGTATQSGSGGGAVTLNGTVADINATLANGVTYQGDQDFNGTDAITVTVNDNGNNPVPALTDTETIGITVGAINDAPEIVSEVLAGDVTEDDPKTQVSGQIVADDVDGDNLTWSVVDGGAGIYGDLAIDQGGAWTYSLGNETPALDGLDDGETVTESFAIEISDGNNGTVQRTVEINIHGHSDGLFTESADNVDFNLISAGSYTDGTQYYAFGGNDVVYLPTDSAAASTSGFLSYRDFRAGEGDDQIFGGDLGNRIFGDLGDDLLVGGQGRDLLIGGYGNDTLIGGQGRDPLDGGPGNDTADYSTSSGHVKVELIRGIGYFNDAQGDRLHSIENLVGSNFDDTLVGGAAANAISGGDGNDELYGGGGADTLLGGIGEDSLFGDDLTLDYASGSEGLFISSYGASNDYLSGGVGNDKLYGGGGDDTLVGGEGADILDGGFYFDPGNLPIGSEGNFGVDTADYSTSAGRVEVYLNTGHGYFHDAEGDQLVKIENLIGSAYNDTLVGSSGANVLHGGDGDDLFIFTNGGGDDTVTDFTAGVGSDDVLNIADFGFADLAALLAATNDAGANTVITLDGDDRITLIGVQEVQLHADDFLFV